MEHCHLRGIYYQLNTKNKHPIEGSMDLDMPGDVMYPFWTSTGEDGRSFSPITSVLKLGAKTCIMPRRHGDIRNCVLKFKVKQD